MSEKKRPPRFEDIVALSHQPPKKNLFALAYDGEEEQRKAGLQKVTVADLPPIPSAPEETPHTLGTQSTHLGTQGLGNSGRPDTQDTQGRLGTQTNDLVLPPASTDHAGMKKWKDSREQLNLKLSQDILENLRRYAFDNRLTVKDSIVKAINLLLGTQKGTQGRLGTQGMVGRNLPTYDDDIEDDDGPTIELYEKNTGNNFTANDRACLNEYKSFGHDCVQLAILLGRSRYRGKQINSFRFFEKIIKEVAAWQPDKIAKELAFQMAEFRRRSRR